MDSSRNPGDSATVFTVHDDDFATEMARRIVTVYWPHIVAQFIKKNRKYRKVTNNLGARGVFPDINRKTGILEARVWDGDGEPDDGSESTVEVIDDLIGHLLIMRDMLIQEALPEWDGSVGRVMVMPDDDSGEVPDHIHQWDNLMNCMRCGHPHVGKEDTRTVVMYCQRGCKEAMTRHWHELRRSDFADVIHPGDLSTADLADAIWADRNGTILQSPMSPAAKRGAHGAIHTKDLLPDLLLPRPVTDNPQA